MTKFEDNISPYLSFVEGAAPSSPSATNFKLYYDSSDHLLKWKNSAGTVTSLATNPMTTAEDIIYGGASGTPTRKAKGADGTFLGVAAGVLGYAAVTDALLSTSDITTNNASTAKHGFAPKLPNDATKYYDGTGAFSTPGGGGGSFSSYDALIAAMSGLVHRWKFEEASGNFADSVGSLTLTVSGTVPTYSVAGGPVSGGSGSVTFGATTKAASSGMGSIPVGSGNPVTIVAIHKPDTATSLQPVASYGTASTRQAIAIAPGYIAGAAAIGIGFLCWADDLSFTSSQYRDGVYHMDALMLSGGAFSTGFHDGLLAGKNLGGTPNLVDDGTHFTVGTCQNAVGGQFKGTIDDLAIFNRQLHPYELQQLYNALVGALP